MQARRHVHGREYQDYELSGSEYLLSDSDGDDGDSQVQANYLHQEPPVPLTLLDRLLILVVVLISILLPIVLAVFGLAGSVALLRSAVDIVCVQTPGLATWTAFASRFGVPNVCGNVNRTQAPLERSIALLHEDLRDPLKELTNVFVSAQLTDLVFETVVNEMEWVYTEATEVPEHFKNSEALTANIESFRRISGDVTTQMNDYQVEEAYFRDLFIESLKVLVEDAKRLAAREQDTSSTQSAIGGFFYSNFPSLARYTPFGALVERYYEFAADQLLALEKVMSLGERLSAGIRKVQPEVRTLVAQLQNEHAIWKITCASGASVGWFGGKTDSGLTPSEKALYCRSNTITKRLIEAIESQASLEWIAGTLNIVQKYYGQLRLALTSILKVAPREAWKIGVADLKTLLPHLDLEAGYMKQLQAASSAAKEQLHVRRDEVRDVMNRKDNKRFKSQPLRW